MSTIEFPPDFKIVTAPDPILEGYQSDSLYTGHPDALARPRSEEELALLLAWCNQNNVPVTPCGNRTSMTGGSVADKGLALSIENLSKEWRLYEDPAKPGRWLVDAGPAIILSDLQDQLAAKGFFYPPDPTSRKEVLLGATVATNASGEDSYKYGATRRWVRGLRFVKADGSVASVSREVDAVGDARKNTCGYPVRDSMVDLLVGSEGTLGIITALTLEVLPRVPVFFSILAFFPSEADALKEAVAWTEDASIDLRCLEYMDAGALAILREKAAGLEVPEKADCALYLKQEFSEDDEMEKMEFWAGALEERYEAMGVPEFAEYIHLAGDDASQQKLRDWRHLIPATINERAAGYRRSGGGKVGTDWHVPLNALLEMFEKVRADQQDMEWVVFGHIGNGHPHFNFIAKNAEEYAQARELLKKHCELAVAFGGGISAEHGLGKLKAHLLGAQYNDAEIDEMLALKREMDPNGILAPGNIFGGRLKA